MSRPLGLAGRGRLWPCDDDDEEEDDNFIDDGRGDDNGECVEKLMTNLK